MYKMTLDKGAADLVEKVVQGDDGVGPRGPGLTCCA